MSGSTSEEPAEESAGFRAAQAQSSPDIDRSRRQDRDQTGGQLGAQAEHSYPALETRGGPGGDVAGALLVVVVLFLFLGNMRAGLVVALAIPLSMLFAGNLMLQAGIAASLLSLGAIDFGIIVDGSVVMVENAVRRLVAAYEQEKGPEFAALFTGDFTFEFSNATDPTLTVSNFHNTGGGALFQLGPDVVSNQQARLGIQSMNTASLSGPINPASLTISNETKDFTFTGAGSQKRSCPPAHRCF